MNALFSTRHLSWHRARVRLEAEIKELPVHIPVSEVINERPIVQLERERKVITDSIKMVAYRAETQLAHPLGPLLPHREDEARSYLRQALSFAADILPDYKEGTLVVRLRSMTTPRDNRTLAVLCEVLNELEICYPGTPLRMVLKATEASGESL